MPDVSLTDAQAARLLALAQQLDPPQTLAQFIDLGQPCDVRGMSGHPALTRSGSDNALYGFATSPLQYWAYQPVEEVYSLSRPVQAAWR